MQEDFFEPVAQQSQLMWFYTALGLRYALALPLAGLFSFAMTILLLVRGRGSAMVGGLIFLACLPVFIGLVGTLDSMIAINQAIALSNMTPKRSEMMEGTAMSLVSLLVGLILAAPTYGVATVTLIIRALTAPTATTK